MTTPFRGYPLAPAAPAAGRTQINALAKAVDADVAMLSTGYRLAEVRVYTSSATFQKGEYAGIAAVMVECVGGGGGSGYMGATAAGEVNAACGGSGAAFTRTWLTAAELLSAEAVTVGAGGVGGTSGSPNGGAGGGSLFGGHVTAAGGAGGEASPLGTGGGEPWAETTTSVSISRPVGGEPSGTFDVGVAGSGGGGIYFATPSGFAAGGYTEMSGLPGGASGGPYGIDGSHGTATFPVNHGFTAFQTPGLGYGGGANGGYLPQSSAASDGAAGADGVVIVYVYVGVGTSVAVPPGPVITVNGQSGEVVLDAGDVGALPVFGRTVLSPQPGLRWSLGSSVPTTDVQAGDRFTYQAGHLQEGETYRWDGATWVLEFTLAAPDAQIIAAVRGAALVNAVTIGDTATRAYRMRAVEGSALDFEGAGGDLIISMWDNADFTGTQRSYDRYAIGVTSAQHAGPREFVAALFGAAVHTINPDTGVAALGAKNGLTNLMFCGLKGTPGAPSTDTWDTGDLVIDSAGVWHLCTAGGTPGTWT